MDATASGSANLRGGSTVQDVDSLKEPIRDFSIGRVLGATFAIPLRAPMLVLIAAALLVPGYLLYYRFNDVGSPAYGPAEYVGAGIGYLILLVGSYAFQALAPVAVDRVLRTGTFGPGEVARLGLPRVFHIIAVSIVMAVLVWVGFLLLVIPGIIVALMLAVALPVTVIERRGVIESLGRSRSLTKGYRGHIFGLYVVAGIISTVVWLVVFLPASGIFSNDPPAVLPWGAVLAMTLLSVVSLVLYNAGVVALYHELRGAKEGSDADEIVAAFD